MKNRFWQGFWRLADPKISLASFASMFLGACIAAASGPIHFGWLALTVLGVFAIEVAKNASGDMFDFDSGDDQAIRAEDRTPFSGGKRVLLDGLLTRGQTIGIAVVSYFVGIFAGIAIVIWREPSVLWWGILGTGMAFFYHAPPFKLSYRGLGELAVAISYGPLICVGTYLVQRGTVSMEVIVISILLGLLIGSFLLINEFPDYHADRGARKNTLVVRLGRRNASRLFAGLVVLAFVVLFALPFIGYPFTIWLGFAAAPLAYSATRLLLKNPEITSRIIPAQGNTLLAFVLFAFGAGVGLVLG
jgi:1,4-dihydroxy-2-naphthoate octaprenyltransferase